MRKKKIEQIKDNSCKRRPIKVLMSINFKSIYNLNMFKMKNENLKKLAGELISTPNVDNGLEIINDAQSSKIKGGLACTYSN